MPESRGTDRPTPESIAAWEARRYTLLRRQEAADTPFDDALPVEVVTTPADAAEALRTVPR